MLQTFKKLLQHELITGSFYIFLGSMVLNVCAFLFNLIFARKLTAADYGIYTSLIALFTLITIPAQPIATTIVKFASDFFAEGDIEQAASLYRKFLKILSLMGIALLCLLLIFSQFILQFLHISQPFLLFLMAIMVGIFYISIVQNAFLQSQLRFKLAGILMALGGVIKLLFGVIFLLAGFQVFGAIGALIVSILLPFVIAFYPLGFLIKAHKREIQVNIRKIVVYIIPASLAIIGLTLFTSTDVLLVKHFFPPTQAGLYAGISIAGKVIFYFTGTIPMVMFPLLIKRYKKGENIDKLLFLSLSLVCIPSLGITLVYEVFPHVIVSIFLGKTIYQSIAGYLGLYGLFITVYSMINIMTLFFLSLQKNIPIYVTLFGSISQIVLLSLFHSTFSQVIGISSILALFILVLLLLYYVNTYAKHKKGYQAATLNNYPRV